MAFWTIFIRIFKNVNWKYYFIFTDGPHKKQMLTKWWPIETNSLDWNMFNSQWKESKGQWKIDSENGETSTITGRVK